MRRLFFLLLLLVPFIAESQIAQFRGPQRTGSYPDKNLLDKWPDGGPQLLLTIEGIGKGWSSAVTNDKAIYITGMKDTLDYLTSIDLTGKINWQVPFGRSFQNSFKDTRCTPTVEGNNVWVISGTGKLSCFDATTGKENWSVFVDKTYQSKWFNWGVAESVLVVDNKVICSPYGAMTALVAYDKNTGKLIWQSKSVGGKRSFVSPQLYTYKNFKYILSSNTEKTIAVNAENGDIAWEYKTKGAEISANTPLFKGNEIYITCGYDAHSVMLKMAEDGKSVSEKWVDSILDNHHGGVVVVNGTIYGSNWIGNDNGKWCSLDWNTGKIGYETKWNNKGSIITADNKLYILEEKTGNVGLANPNPAKFDLVSYFKLDKGTGDYWAHPMIHDGKLYIRHGDMLMIYNIKK